MVREKSGDGEKAKRCSLKAAGAVFASITVGRAQFRSLSRLKSNLREREKLTTRADLEGGVILPMVSKNVTP